MRDATWASDTVLKRLDGRLRGSWLLGLALALGGCMMTTPGQPDLTATETAIEAAVVATGTALAASLPPPPTAAPATATTASASVSPTAATKPTTVVTPQLEPTSAAGASAATPRPAVTRTAAPLTSEEAAYVRSVVPFINQFNMSFERFAELIREAKPEEASWRLALGAELRLWADGAEAARSTRPPDSMQPIHRHVLTGLDSYRDASRLITEALQQGDSEQVRKGIEAVQAGRRSFAEASRELQRLAEERGL